MSAWPIQSHNLQCYSMAIWTSGNMAPLQKPREQVLLTSAEHNATPAVNTKTIPCFSQKHQGYHNCLLHRLMSGPTKYHGIQATNWTTISCILGGLGQQCKLKQNWRVLYSAMILSPFEAHSLGSPKQLFTPLC